MSLYSKHDGRTALRISSRFQFGGTAYAVDATGKWFTGALFDGWYSVPEALNDNTMPRSWLNALGRARLGATELGSVQIAGTSMVYVTSSGRASVVLGHQIVANVLSWHKSSPVPPPPDCMHATVLDLISAGF